MGKNNVEKVVGEFKRFWELIHDLPDTIKKL